MEKGIYTSDASRFSVSDNWSGVGAPVAHFHPEYEIYYLTDGIVEYLVNNKLYRIHTGNVVCIPPGVSHKSLQVLSIERKRMLLYVTPFDMQRYTESCPEIANLFDNFIYSPTREQGAKVKSIFASIAEEQNLETPNAAMMDALIMQLLITLGRSNKYEGESESINNTALQCVDDISRYLDARFSEDVTLSKLSSVFHMNPSYISRVFKQKIGVSITEYLANVRIRYATDMLFNTNMTVTDIAESAGFASCNNFCVVFKKHTGMSPLKFRNANRNEQ